MSADLGMFASLIAEHGFELGWDALVALGTLLLALATGYLALKTSGLANASAADLRAQWRPAVIPEDYYLSMPVQVSGDSLRFKLRNSGRGPALYFRAGITLDPDTPNPSVEPPDLTGVRAALAPGDVVMLTFNLDRRPDRCALLIDYQDLSDRAYSTKILMGRVARTDAQHDFDELLVTDTLLYEDQAVTPWPRPVSA